MCMENGRTFLFIWRFIMLTKFTLLATVVLGLAGAAVLAAGPPAAPAGEPTAQRDAPCVAAGSTPNATAGTNVGPGFC